MKFADSFRAAYWVRLANLLLQAVLFLTLFAGLNYVAQNHSWRFDLTAYRKQSLSAETRSYLERLERDVQVYVTFTDDTDQPAISQAWRDLDGLLREYAYATRAKPEGRGRLTVRFVDVFVQRREAESLNLETPNVVVVACEGRRRVVPPHELYDTKREGGNYRREAFKAESALTAAILDVSSPEKKKIYFVRGHGETGPDDLSPAGLSVLRDELVQRNFELAPLELAVSRKVPDDAALLLVAGPQGPFKPHEEELLRNYLQTRAGRIIMLLNPGIAPLGLENLFFDWGLLVYDNVIYDTNPDNITETGEFYLKNFHRTHPLVQNHVSNGLPLVIGPARVVNEDLGRTVDDGLDVTTLVVTSPTAWGESSYRLRALPQFTPGQDLQGQLGVLVISERVKPAPQISFSVRGGRLAVFGAADLVSNNRIFNIGNLNLFLSLTNWAVDRDTQLNIPARPVERFQLALSQEELLRLRLGLLLLLPGAVAALGLVVYWTRRN